MSYHTCKRFVGFEFRSDVCELLVYSLLLLLSVLTVSYIGDEHLMEKDRGVLSLEALPGGASSASPCSKCNGWEDEQMSRKYASFNAATLAGRNGRGLS